eukprot:TRINITY_DN5162_c0_g1_i2.p1 TRINITY_DN5162_c0_g1~~TRINITY_DN5162_c0_g1_i2.p1  ORF type:complete len:692 (-),score=102.19 TRINITY_DN5162_c0_g1_i2:719-2794(-)
MNDHAFEVISSDTRSPFSVLDDCSTDGDDEAGGILGYFGLVSGRLRAKRLWSRFTAYCWAIVLGLAVEVLFCLTMSSWSDRNEAVASNFQGHVTVADTNNLKEAYWGVFTGCVSMRVLSVVLWRNGFCHWRDTTFASMYMFFSTVQWIFYLAAYYWLYDELTGVVWSPEVQVKYNPLLPSAPNMFSNSNGTQRHRVHDMTMRSCLKRYGPAVCYSLNLQQVGCEEVFSASRCSGWIWLGADDAHRVKCCVRNRYTLSPPDLKVPILPWDIHTFFPVLQWLAVLVMSWMTHDSPMLPSSSAYTNFMTGVWLDILDAVIFGDYVLNKKVWYPTYGILAEPASQEGYAGPENTWPQLMVWRLWLLAFISAVLSPVVYTFFRRADAAEDVDPSERNVSHAITNLLHSIRLLDKGSASEALELTLDLQRAEYMTNCSINDTHRVRVRDAMSQAGGFAIRSQGRIGRARLDERQGFGKYRINFDDGEEDVVHVSQLEPAFEGDWRMWGPKCCWGWCGKSGACSRRISKRQRFERVAAVLDSLRSLFLLELPFFLLRLHFESTHFDTNTVDFLMLKNFVWAITDFLTIIACGNHDATCFTVRPIRWVTDHIDGTILSFIWVGPGGLFRVATDATIKTVADRIEAQRQDVCMHKAWLVIEQSKAMERGSSEAVAAYRDEISRLDVLLADLDKQEAMNHM